MIAVSVFAEDPQPFHRLLRRMQNSESFENSWMVLTHGVSWSRFPNELRIAAHLAVPADVLYVTIASSFKRNVVPVHVQGPMKCQLLRPILAQQRYAPQIQSLRSRLASKTNNV